MAPPSCYGSRCCGLMVGLFCVVFFVVYLGWCIYSVKVSPERPYFPLAILLYVYVIGAAVSLTFAYLYPSDDYNDMQEQDPEDRPPRDDIEMNVLNLEQQGPSRQVQADVPDVNSASDSIQECSQTESAAHGTDQSESGDGVVLKPGQLGQSQEVTAVVHATDSAADSVPKSTGKKLKPDSANPVTDLSKDKEKALNPNQLPEEVPDQHSQSQNVIAEVHATDSAADSVRRSTGKKLKPDSAYPVAEIAEDKEKVLNPEQVPEEVPDQHSQSQKVIAEAHATDSAADSVRKSTGKQPDSADPVIDLAEDKEMAASNPEQVPEEVPDQHSHSQEVIAKAHATDSAADSVRKSTGKRSEPHSADPVTDLAEGKEKAELNPEQVPEDVPDAQIASEEQTRFRRAVSEQTVFKRATKTDSDASIRWNTQ